MRRRELEERGGLGRRLLAAGALLSLLALLMREALVLSELEWGFFGFLVSRVVGSVFLERVLLVLTLYLFLLPHVQVVDARSAELASELGVFGVDGFTLHAFWTLVERLSSSGTEVELISQNLHLRALRDRLVAVLVHELVAPIDPDVELGLAPPGLSDEGPGLVRITDRVLGRVRVLGRQNARDHVVLLLLARLGRLRAQLRLRLLLARLLHLGRGVGRSGQHLIEWIIDK